MKIFIVSGRRGRFEDRHAWIVGVFRTREAAEAAAEEQRQLQQASGYTFDTDAFWLEPVRYVVEEFTLDQ